ncbi:MAG: hypothetical protein R3345_08675 [Fulvivirga sp.]|nr:hypothetical protein [Fulvivirga sp.]
MKKDIEYPVVKNVNVAIVPEQDDAGNLAWRVYLVNNNNFALENTLVTSTGYGKKAGEKQKTSTIRQFLDTVPANEGMIIESIAPEVFHLNNEYWVSYYVKGKMFDKKFIFLPDTIQEDNLVFIKTINKKGILHS